MTARHALVTGSSKGIGRATAVRLAELGVDCVVIHHRRSEAEALEAACEVEKAGARALVVAADLEDRGSVEAMFDTIGAELGHLDILVANAAASAFKPLLETHDLNIERTAQITVHAFLQCVRRTVAMAPERGGSIVAVSGIDAGEAMVAHGLLGSMKAALETLAMYLAAELGPRGFNVNAVRPGLTLTESERVYAQKVFGDAGLFEQRLSAITPLRRAGTPRDLANVIGFLCTSEGSWISGQTILADGGLSIVSPTDLLGLTVEEAG